MKWTREYPSRVGWYWCRLPRKPCTGLFTFDACFYDGHLLLWAGSSEPSAPDEYPYSKGEWFGPLPVPESSEEATRLRHRDSAVKMIRRTQ